MPRMKAKDLIQLRADLAAARKEGKAKVAEFDALSAKTERSADETAKLAALDAAITAVEAKVVEMAEKLEAEETAARREVTFSPRPAAQPRDPNARDPAATNGFAHIAEFAVAVRAAYERGNPQPDERLFAAPTGYMQNQGTSGEGFLVPAEFRREIWELVFQSGSLLDAAMPEPTASNRIEFAKDETTPWGTSGVVAYWRAEAAAMTASKFPTKGGTLDLHELYAFVLASDELLADAPLLASRLTKKAADAIRWKASEAIMTGNGVGQPLGIMSAGALVTQAKESGQAAATLVTANIFKMFSRLLGPSIARSVWYMNPDVLPQLGVMQIGDQPIWTPPVSGLKQAPGGFLLGRPIEFSEHCQTIGTLGDVVLADMGGYAAAVKQGGGLDFASSIHLYFDYGVQAFRWTFRLAGQPYLSAPITPPKSANTRSHFVALATRA